MANKYPLEPLRQARKRREQEAIAEVAKCRKNLADREQDLVNAKKKLEDYKVWRVEEEARRWEKFLAGVYEVKELEEFREGLSELAREELLHEEKVKQAVTAVEEAKQQLVEARKRHAEAMRKLEKLDEHRKQWENEQRKEEERKQDLEFEDFRSLQLEAAFTEPLDFSHE